QPQNSQPPGNIIPPDGSPSTGAVPGLESIGDPTDTIAALLPLGNEPGTGAVTALVNDLTGATSGDTGIGDLLSTTGPVVGRLARLATNTILDLNDLLEGSGNQLGQPANSVVSALTDFGESVGLGQLGTAPNLLTSIADAPGAILGGQAVPAVNDIVNAAVG